MAREHSTEANARLQIYQTNIKKQALQKLTEHDSSTQLNPVYLSKGKKIAYIRAYDDGWELWVMDNKGKRQRLVARDIKKLDNFYGSYYFYEIMDVYR